MLLSIVCVLAVILAVLLCMCSGAFGSLAWLWVLPVGLIGGVLALAVLVFLLLWLMCKTVDMDKPQEKDSAFFRNVAHLVVDALLPVLRIRIHTQGLEKLPGSGRFLLVCNHIHDIDPAVLLTVFRKQQLAFISKRENDQKFIIGPFLHRIMCQPINRENDREALKTILKCIQLIKDDEVSIGVFPEGYTSLDGLLHPFRSGVFKIAQKADVPIVVCTVRNTRSALRNAKRLKPTDIHLHLVGVIEPQELKGVTAVQIGERVHAMMAEDLGPDLVLPAAENQDTP